MGRYEEFQAYRSRMNARILGGPAPEGAAPAGAGAEPGGGGTRRGGTLVTKRFFSLDHQAYAPGALDARTKELLGLVASMVLRCDDCIAYHVDRAVQEGAGDEEIWEAFDIALIVGGSIVVPHLRRAVEFLDECRARGRAGS